MSERGRFTKTMTSDQVVFEQKRKQVIEDLFVLISQNCSVLYRLGETLINDICPVKGCGMKMTK